MLAFGIGNPADWAIIFVLALIVFGPKKLPELGQQLGQALREFRKVADEFTGAADTVRNEVSSVGNALRTPLNDVRTTATSAILPLRTSVEPVPTKSDELIAPVPVEPVRVPENRGLRISTAIPDEDISPRDVQERQP